ncbi:MAG: hypothetical protein A2Y77_16780 [Planctomycetes bacterium RBG_13_62_9]|nr:MAG: hypothetical protein A2Y77_16780 [Planctomycetes bacterium RBG_13_62_9]
MYAATRRLEKEIVAETEAILLKRFAGSGDAQAFAEIIRRHAGLVYGAALRILTDVDRASDVAQETFLQLAKDAGNVTGSLPGWLHRVATHKAIDEVRRDISRRHRERQYVAGEPREAVGWRDISPHVDVALRELHPELREILIQHFLQGRTTREIAAARGTSQATISRRIGLGVEQLRVKLRKRGIIVAVGALSVLLGDNAVQAAPLPLLMELGKMAMVGGAVAGTASAGTGLHTLAASILAAAKTKAVAVAAVVIVGAGSVVTYQQVTKHSSSERPTTAAAGATATSSAALDSGLVYDPPGQFASADRQWPAGRGARGPAIQGQPGPEAETDPRAYIPNAASSGVADPGGTVVAASAPLQADTPDRQAPAVYPGSPEDPNRPVIPQAKESAYEMVMRLRREAAQKCPISDLPAAASLGRVVAKVELKLVPPFRGSPAGMLGLQRQDTTTVRPIGVRETPRDAPREPVYFVVHAGDRQIQGITYRSTRLPGEVMLFLDTDGDGLWSDEKGYVGRRLWIFSLSATYEFGPVFLRQGQVTPGGDAFYAQCSDGKWLTFWPAFYREGAALLDGKTYRIVLVDSNFNGRFNESFVPPAVDSRDPGCDVLAIDLNGDSEFIGRQPSDELEIMPLSKLIRLGGRYYGLEVAEDGSTVEFRQAEPQSGVLDLGGKAVQLELWSEAGRQQLSGSGGVWRLPVGRYGAVSLSLTETNAGNRWTFEMFRAEAGQLKDFEIKPGQTTAFKIGPPFQIRTSMERLAQNPFVTVGFELQGQGGELYSGAPKKDGTEPPEPSLKILNGAGQVVQSGQFAYS